MVTVTRCRILFKMNEAISIVQWNSCVENILTSLLFGLITCIYGIYRHWLIICSSRCFYQVCVYSNDEVLSKAKLQPLSDIVRAKRLKLAGHILNFPEERPASVALNWEPVSGKRRQGRRQKTWRTTFKEDLHAMEVTGRGAKRVSSDHSQWKELVTQCPRRDRRSYV